MKLKRRRYAPTFVLRTALTLEQGRDDGIIGAIQAMPEGASGAAMLREILRRGIAAQAPAVGGTGAAETDCPGDRDAAGA